MRHASEGLCFRRLPIGEPPDLIYQLNLHPARERYRVLAEPEQTTDNTVIEVLVHRKAKHASGLLIAL